MQNLASRHPHPRLIRPLLAPPSPASLLPIVALLVSDLTINPHTVNPHVCPPKCLQRTYNAVAPLFGLLTAQTPLSPATSPL